MDYLVLTSDFCIKEFEKQLEILPYDYSKEGLSLSYVDDFYADREGFASSLDDGEDALKHALLMLRNIQKNRNEKQEIIYNWKNTLINDISNYFQCLRFEKGNYTNTVIYIMEEMAEEGLGLELADLIEEYYKGHYIEACSEYISFDGTKLPDIALDYDQVYKRIGDRFLFLKSNIDYAMRFYNLANIDWFFVRDHDKLDNYLTDSQRIDEMKEWNLTYLFWESLIYHKKIPNKLPQLDEQEKPYFKILRKVIDIINSEKDCDKLVELAEQYMELLTQYLSDQPKISISRNILVMSYVIRQSSIMFELETIDNMSTSMKNKMRQNIIKSISIIGNVFQGATLDIEKYVEKHLNDKNLFNVVSLLAQTYIHECEIKYQLKVREPDTTVAYYTSLDTLMKMLPPQQTDPDKYGKPAIMHFAYMDDPTEGEILFDHLCPFEDHGAEGRTDVEYPFVFMKCFTSLVDDLSMWEMYGDHAKGCCLVINWGKTILTNNDNQEIPLYRVCYLDNHKNEVKINKNDNPKINIKNRQTVEKLLKTLQVIAEKLEDLNAGDDFKSLLGDLPYLFKSNNYAHEQELRVIYNCIPTDTDIKHTDEQVPKLYVQAKFTLIIQEIVFGPKFEDLSLKLPYIQEQVALMGKKNKVKTPEYTYSSIEYK